MTKEFDDFLVEVKEGSNEPKYWEDAIQQIVQAAANLGAYRHANYGVSNIIELGQDGCIKEIRNKTARINEYFRLTTTIETLQRFSLPIPDIISQKIASEKYSDAVGDIINYAIYTIMLSQRTADGTLYWLLPMRPSNEET